jgi:hypothetical protein
MMQGAGAPQDHFIIPPIFLGIETFYLRDNGKIQDEMHKILARTVSRGGSRSHSQWRGGSTHCVVSVTGVYSLGY